MVRCSKRSGTLLATLVIMLVAGSSWAETTSIDFDMLPTGFFPAGQTVVANSFTTISSENGFSIGTSFFDDGEDAITIQNASAGDIIFTFDSAAVIVNGVTFTGRSNNVPVVFSIYNADGASVYTAQTDPDWLFPAPLSFGLPNGWIGVRLLESEIRSLTIDFEPANSDADGDGLPDSLDNCSQVPNSNQSDTDADGFGNICDGDLNNDCVVNVQDLGLFRLEFFGNDENADLNGDGVVNVTDLGILRLAFFLAPGPSGIQDCTP